MKDKKELSQGSMKAALVEREGWRASLLDQVISSSQFCQHKLNLNRAYHILNEIVYYCKIRTVVVEEEILK